MTEYKLVPVEPTEAMIRSAMQYDSIQDPADDPAMVEQIKLDWSLMLAAAPDSQPLRYTSDGAVAECPCCGSLNVGGVNDTVGCYDCSLFITKQRPLQNAIDAWNTRTGRTHPAPDVQGEPVAYQIREKGSDNWHAISASHYQYITSRKHDWDHAEVRGLYATPQPAEQQPDVTQLVEALEEARRELNSCQSVIHYAGGFDPAYVTGAQAALVKIDAALDAYRKGGDAP